MSDGDDELRTEARASELDAWTIASAIWARRGRVLLTMGIIVAITAGVVYSITPRYSSQSKILIENRESRFTQSAPGGDAQFLSDQAAVLSQVEVLSSRDLAMKVVEKLGLVDLDEFSESEAGGSVIGGLLVSLGLYSPTSDEAEIERVIETYTERLTVFQIGTSRVIAVEFSSADAELAASVANTLADEYIAVQRSNKLDTNQEAVSWLGREIEVLRERVAEAEANVARFRNESGLFSTSRETTLSQQQMSELSAELVRASAAQSEARAKSVLITELLEEPGSIEEVADVLNSQLIQRLREQQAAVSREHAELSATMLPGHPRMRELTAELADLEQRILGEARKIARGLENEAALAGARVEAIRTSLTEFQNDAGASSQAEVQLRALEREAAAQREILESFLRRFREATTRQDVEVQSADARIISKASVSTTPTYPPRGPILALASLAGLLLGLMSALLADGSSGRRAAAPAARIPDDPLPPQKPEGQPGGEVLDAPVGMTRVVDRMRAISKTNTDEPALPQTATTSDPAVDEPIQPGGRLAELVAQRGVRRVAVLHLAESADALDVATRLADAAAECGMKPVVVEAAPGGDEAQSDAGLFDVLSGKAALGEVLTTAPGGATTVVRAGAAPENRDELVNSGRITLVVDALLRRFDAALVVAGALGAGDTAAAIAATCDHVLIVIPDGEVNVRRIKAVTDQLAKSGIRRVSIVGESDGGLTLHEPADTEDRELATA